MLGKQDFFVPFLELGKLNQLGQLGMASAEVHAHAAADVGVIYQGREVDNRRLLAALQTYGRILWQVNRAASDLSTLPIQNGMKRELIRMRLGDLQTTASATLNEYTGIDLVGLASAAIQTAEDLGPTEMAELVELFRAIPEQMASLSRTLEKIDGIERGWSES